MARLFSQDYPKGSVTRINVNASAQLKNQLGDPTEREVLVYHPADYNGEDVPIIIDLPPFTGSGLSRAGFRPFSESVTDILDRLWAEGKIPPALYVFPDTYTRLGGTPFTPSSILGDQGAFIVEALLPTVKSLFHLSGKQGAFLTGKSFGGYGVLHLINRYPGVFRGAACHSGSMGLELSALPILRRFATHLSQYGHSIKTFLSEVSQKRLPNDDDTHGLLALAMAAGYDCNQQLETLSLPIDLKTGVLHKEAWKTWEEMDPLHFVPANAAAYQKLETLYLDVGSFDQYNLHFGARSLHALMTEQKIPHIFEEFDGTHQHIDYRLEVSLPKLLDNIRKDHAGRTEHAMSA